MASTSTYLRRALRLGAVAAPALVVLVATPAMADVPEGWSNPDPVSAMEALMIWVILPVAVAMLISLLYFLPSFARTARRTPSVTEPQPQPEDEAGLDELLGPGETHELEAGAER
jgi:hypothetical protein